MTIVADRTIRDLAQELPGAARVLEQFGLDYCCGGDRGLEEACRTAKISLDASRLGKRASWRACRAYPFHAP